jgi:hypothetical protein
MKSSLPQCLHSKSSSLGCVDLATKSREYPVNVTTSPGIPATDDDLNRLTDPDVGYDAEKEPPAVAVEQFGWSKEDTAEFRLWMAAGLPRYWKGKNRFPALNDEQWSEFRRKFRINLAEKNRTNPPPARGY